MFLSNLTLSSMLTYLQKN